MDAVTIVLWCCLGCLLLYVVLTVTGVLLWRRRDVLKALKICEGWATLEEIAGITNNIARETRRITTLHYPRYKVLRTLRRMELTGRIQCTVGYDGNLLWRVGRW